MAGPKQGRPVYVHLGKGHVLVGPKPTSLHQFYRYFARISDLIYLKDRAREHL